MTKRVALNRQSHKIINHLHMRSIPRKQAQLVSEPSKEGRKANGRTRPSRGEGATRGRAESRGSRASTSEEVLDIRDLQGQVLKFDCFLNFFLECWFLTL